MTVSVIFMFIVYVLFCCDRRLYIGYTTDVKKRVKQHQNGECKSTKFRRPLKLIYFGCYANENDAKAREVFLKSGAGHQQLKNQHKNLFQKLRYRDRLKK